MTFTICSTGAQLWDAWRETAPHIDRMPGEDALDAISRCKAELVRSDAYGHTLAAFQEHIKQCNICRQSFIERWRQEIG